MIAAAVRSWSAWSPGIEDADAWRRWCAAPRALAEEGHPEAAFLPAMLRRRCGALARVMLTTAFDCCGPDELANAASVFASRHGNINESIDLLDRLADRRALSPTRFSHTVHNAQAGLFSIAADNRCASSSIAAQRDSFACGYLEALTLLEREPSRPVLLVVGDVPLEPRFGPVAEPGGTYGLALLLVSDASDALAFGLHGGSDVSEYGGWPDAVEFLRWYLSDEPELVIAHGRRRWTWRRSARAAA